MFITVTGKLGSGKSTVCKALANEHGFKVYSTGTIHREIAKNRGISTIEMNEYMIKDTSFDFEIDREVERLSKEQEGKKIVFDSRMAWHFVPKSFKVFVYVDPLVAAKRVIADPRGEEEPYEDLQDAMVRLLQRAQIENRRFIEIYGADYFDYDNYDLVVDSTYFDAKTIAEKIYERYLEFTAGERRKEILLTPYSVYPTKPVKRISNEKVETILKSQDEFLKFPPEVILFDNYHYILKGHHIYLAAIKGKVPYINVKLVNKTELSTVKHIEGFTSKLSKLSIECLYDYEKTGNFLFSSYPVYYSSVSEGK